MKISDNGLNIIKLFEGLRLEAYKDTAGIPTIGYGTIRYPSAQRVKMGDRCTIKQAEEWLNYEVSHFEKDVSGLVKVPINQNQFDALVSFAYNVGSDIDQDSIPEGLGDSTLLKLVNQNPNEPAIAAAFAKWNRSGGKVTKGLVKRRVMESQLYFS